MITSQPGGRGRSAITCDCVVAFCPYDANGSLISDGVKTYTYNSANRLIEVNDGSSLTSLTYNGLGQRLSMDAAGVIATYVLDGDLPLTATSSGNTTFFLYGRGPIGEKTTTWNYSLLDGTNTPRQLSDPNGDITLSTRYTPWGDNLELNGTGNFTFGYIGGILDVATGLIYVGNGQYYDPTTGRFLTRDVNPDSPNPYVPWNPVGAILGPLGVLSLVAMRRRGKGKKNEPYLFLFIMLVVLPLSVGMACDLFGPPAQTQPPTQAVPLTATEIPPATVPSITPTATQSPTDPPMDPECCTPTPTKPGGGSNPQNLSTSQKEKNVIKYWEAGQLPPPEQPYEDIAGKCTIGYGHTFWNPHHPEGKGCSREVREWYAAHPLPYTGPEGTDSAESFLQSDIEKSELIIERNITADLSQAQFDALVSYIFNVGEGKLIEKKIPELINSGNYEEAAAAIASGPITSGGVELDILKERRKAEAHLFLTGDYGNYVPWSP